MSHRRGNDRAPSEGCSVVGSLSVRAEFCHTIPERRAALPPFPRRFDPSLVEEAGLLFVLFDFGSIALVSKRSLT